MKTVKAFSGYEQEEEAITGLTGKKGDLLIICTIPMTAPV